MTVVLKNYSFIEKLKALPFVKAVYLYGSRARGDNHDRSDIDLALSCADVTRSDWRRVRDIIENADTLLGIDCVHLEEIERICKEKDAFLFAEADGVMPPSAICGYSADLEFMGHRAALYLYDILVKKKKVRDLPIFEYENQSRVLLNKNAAIKHGVTLPSKDFLMTFDDKRKYPFTLAHLYDFVGPYQTIFEDKLCGR